MLKPPAACSLAPADAQARCARFAALAVEVVPEPRGGIRMRLRDGAEPEVRALIAAEAECCPFLTFTLEHEDGALVLHVDGMDA